MQKVVWGAPSFWIERFPLYWGIEQSFFEKQGIDLDIWYGYGASELTRAFSKGLIHIGELGLPPFVTAFRQGLRAKIIGSSVVQQLDHSSGGPSRYCLHRPFGRLPHRHPVGRQL